MKDAPMNVSPSIGTAYGARIAVDFKKASKTNLLWMILLYTYLNSNFSLSLINTDWGFVQILFGLWRQERSVQDDPEKTSIEGWCHGSSHLGVYQVLRKSWNKHLECLSSSSSISNASILWSTFDDHLTSYIISSLSYPVLSLHKTFYSFQIIQSLFSMNRHLYGTSFQDHWSWKLYSILREIYHFQINVVYCWKMPYFNFAYLSTDFQPHYPLEAWNIGQLAI